MSILAIGSDLAGYKLKEEIVQYFIDRGIEVLDLGCNGSVGVDYPDYAEKVAQTLSGNGQALGVLICSTGIGMTIAANKLRGIRAARCHTEYEAQISRSQFDSNVICLGARLVEKDNAIRVIKKFIRSEFEGKRHQGRLTKIEKLAS